MADLDPKALRKEIMRLMREDFDPTPAGWEGRDWNDNAEDVADRIVALLAALPKGEPVAWRQKAANILRNFHRNSCYPDAMAGEVDAAVDAMERLAAPPGDER